jgi:hypothetical protein
MFWIGLVRVCCHSARKFRPLQLYDFSDLSREESDIILLKKLTGLDFIIASLWFYQRVVTRSPIKRGWPPLVSLRLLEFIFYVRRPRLPGMNWDATRVGCTCAQFTLAGCLHLPWSYLAAVHGPFSILQLSTGCVLYVWLWSYVVRPAILRTRLYRLKHFPGTHYPA